MESEKKSSMRKKRNKTVNAETSRGLSIIECLIAVMIVGIALISALELISASVKNGSFTKRLDDVKSLASAKAAELAKDADSLVKAVPSGRRTAGSLAPAAPVAGYYDVLNDSFQPINDPGDIKSPKFVRQWLVFKDLPTKGEVTILVSVAYKYDSRIQIMRVAEAVKTDGLKISKS